MKFSSKALAALLLPVMFTTACTEKQKKLVAAGAIVALGVAAAKAKGDKAGEGSNTEQAAADDSSNGYFSTADSSGTSGTQPAASSSSSGGYVPVAATSAELPANMPQASRKKVDSLPGVSWKATTGMREGTGGAYCVWRCVILEYLDYDHAPTFFIHEAVPLPADQAIDQVISFEKRGTTLIKQSAEDGSSLMNSMALKPDQIALRNAVLERNGYKDSHFFIAIEKDGATVVSESRFSGYLGLGDAQDQRASKEAINAFQAMLSTIEIDASVLESSTARRVEAGGIIYAEEPRFINLVGLPGYWEDDFYEVDRSVLSQQGNTLDNGARYIPPLPDGTTISGVFKITSGASSGSAVTFKSTILGFSKDGRFTTSTDAAALAGIASRGGGSKGQGSYHISGYTLTLRYDNGQTTQAKFFVYPSQLFLNLDGNVYTRDNG